MSYKLAKSLDIEAWIKDNSVSLDSHTLSGSGINSKLIVGKNSNTKWVIKEYNGLSDVQANRMHREIEYLIVSNMACNLTPNLVGFDITRKLIILEYVYGYQDS